MMGPMGKAQRDFKFGLNKKKKSIIKA
jgi:hypothetical protein